MAAKMPPQARARAKRDRRGAVREEVDERIAIVGRHMSDGTWDSRRARTLAASWGVALRTVGDYATQASRLIRTPENAEEIEALRTAALGQLQRVYRAAMERRRDRHGRFVPRDPKALQAATQAVDKLAEIAGLKKQRHEITGKDGAPLIPGTSVTITDLSEEQLQAFVERGEMPRPK